MNIKFYQVDAFTNSLFSGNPAGVIFSNIDNEVLMQQIAYENNLSETAFVSKHNDEYFIRWFTPDIEVDLCGHATLAAAFVYFNFIDTKAKISEKFDFYTMFMVLQALVTPRSVFSFH